MSHQNSFAEEEATQICYPKSQSMFEKYLANRIRLRQGAHTPDTGNRQVISPRTKTLRSTTVRSHAQRALCTSIEKPSRPQVHEGQSLFLSASDSADHHRPTSVIFDIYNITHFLDSGTLLGSFRDGFMIPHDQDADMGIDQRSFEFIQKNPIAMPSKYALHVFGSEIHPDGYRDKELPVRVVHKDSALYMDVFVYIDSFNATTGAKVTGPIPSVCFSPNKCRSCTRVGPRKWQFQLPYEYIYPLQNCPFGHRTLKCPAHTDEYLRFMFGDDYMIPTYDY